MSQVYVITAIINNVIAISLTNDYNMDEEKQVAVYRVD